MALHMNKLGNWSIPTRLRVNIDFCCCSLPRVSHKRKRKLSEDGNQTSTNADSFTEYCDLKPVCANGVADVINNTDGCDSSEDAFLSYIQSLHKHVSIGLETADEAGGPATDNIKLEHDNSAEGLTAVGGQLLPGEEQKKFKLSGKLMCDECGKMYNDSSALVTHKRTHSGERPFLCPKCPTTFSAQRSLNRHLTSSHMDVKPFSCSHCHRSFGRKCHLRRHTLTQHQEDGISDSGQTRRLFSCRDCIEIFSTYSQLRSHKLTVHGNETVCKICSRKFSSVAALTQHLSQHSSEDWEFLCSTCNLIFASDSRFREHMNAHTDPCIPPFACLECNTAFRCKLSLRKHMLGSHTEAPPVEMLQKHEEANEFVLPM